MNEITFLQLRPTDAVNEIWASTRRREGTLVAEVSEPSTDDVRNAQKAGLLIASGSASSEAPAYVIAPSEATAIARTGTAGWRVTVLNDGSRMDVLDALAFTRAAYLRTKRSSVGKAAEMVDIPGGSALVSVFVDDVDDAVAAVSQGAHDLLLRDWDTDRIGELREALSELSTHGTDRVSLDRHLRRSRS